MRAPVSRSDGDLVRAARAAIGATHDELAQLVEVAPSTLTRAIRRGAPGPLRLLCEWIVRDPTGFLAVRGDVGMPSVE